MPTAEATSRRHAGANNRAGVRPTGSSPLRAISASRSLRYGEIVGNGVVSASAHTKHNRTDSAVSAACICEATSYVLRTA
jgi:hypothetical protein